MISERSRFLSLRCLELFNLCFKEFICLPFVMFLHFMKPFVHHRRWESSENNKHSAQSLRQTNEKIFMSVFGAEWKHLTRMEELSRKCRIPFNFKGNLIQAWNTFNYLNNWKIKQKYLFYKTMRMLSPRCFLIKWEKRNRKLKPLQHITRTL